MVSFSSYIGNGLSNLKERPKSNPRVNQNKTRMSNYGLKLCTVRMSNYRLEALYSQQGRKKSASNFFTPPMPPLLQILSTNLRMWDTFSLSKILELLDHLCCVTSWITCHFSGGGIFAQQFHVKITHILLQNDLKHQFFLGAFAP